MKKGTTYNIKVNGVPLAGDANFIGAVTKSGLDITIGSGGGGSGNFSDGEIPSGTINGSNDTFTLANTPTVGSVKVFLNGQRLTSAVDYTVSGVTITMTTIPFPGDILLADYRY